MKKGMVVLFFAILLVFLVTYNLKDANIYTTNAVAKVGKISQQLEEGVVCGLIEPYCPQGTALYLTSDENGCDVKNCISCWDFCSDDECLKNCALSLPFSDSKGYVPSLNLDNLNSVSYWFDYQGKDTLYYQAYDLQENEVVVKLNGFVVGYLEDTSEYFQFDESYEVLEEGTSVQTTQVPSWSNIRQLKLENIEEGLNEITFSNVNNPDLLDEWAVKDISLGESIVCGDGLCEPNEYDVCPTDCYNSEEMDEELDNAPVFEPIPSQTLTVQENFILDLNDYAYDPDGDELNFYVNSDEGYDSDIINCFLTDSKLNCVGKSEGKENLNLLVESGLKETSNILSVFVEPIVSDGKGPVVKVSGLRKADLGQTISLSASESYDETNKELSLQYEWKEGNTIISTSENLRYKRNKEGTYKVDLTVTDKEGLSDSIEIDLVFKKKTKCLGTKTNYYPEDTLCQNKWPGNEGDLLNINSEIKSCDLFEVCDESLDYIVDEAIECCSGSTFEKEGFLACSYARQNALNQQSCQAMYIIQSIGPVAIHVKDYFEAEMCCYGVEGLCLDPKNYYKPSPLPNIEMGIEEDLMCYHDYSWISEIKSSFNEGVQKEISPKKGWWRSDERMRLNNVALSDVPAHVTLNLLNTGTCVDYSSAVTTLIRKLGYFKNEVYTAQSKDHAYNLVKFKGDKKYTIVDTTGNNYAMELNSVPQGYPYCEGLLRCYNDLGVQTCPTLEEIHGCSPDDPIVKIYKNIRQYLNFKRYIGVAGIKPGVN